MPTEKKAQIIDDLEDMFSRCTVGVLTNYRGLTAVEMTGLRRKLKGSGVDYRVVKNTLARIAVEKAGKGALARLFEGQVAIACGFGEEIVPVKAVIDYVRTSKSILDIRGGFLGARPLTAEQIRTLSELPPREVLIAMVIGGIQAPIAALVGQLTAPISGLVGVLQARIQQLEGEAK